MSSFYSMIILFKKTDSLKKKKTLWKYKASDIKNKSMLHT